MAHLSPDTHLRSLLIFGCRDSNSFDLKVNLMGKLYSQCQTLDIYKQLCMGARVLEIKYGSQTKQFTKDNKLSYEELVQVVNSKPFDIRRARLYADVRCFENVRYL